MAYSTLTDGLEHRQMHTEPCHSYAIETINATRRIPSGIYILSFGRHKEQGKLLDILEFKKGGT